MERGPSMALSSSSSTKLGCVSIQKKNNSIKVEEAYEGWATYPTSIPLPFGINRTTYLAPYPLHQFHPDTLRNCNSQSNTQHFQSSCILAPSSNQDFSAQ